MQDTLLIYYIKTAITNNKNIAMAFQKIEMSRSQLLFAKGNRLPQVNLGVSGSIRKFGLYTMDGAGNIVTEITPGKLVPIDLPDYYAGIQSSWEIDFRGKLKNQSKSALAKTYSSSSTVQFVINSLASDVALSYFQLIALDNELLVIRESAEKEKAALDFVKEQKEAGKVNELVVQQFAAQYYNLQILESEVLKNIAKEENRFNWLLGRYPQKVTRNEQQLFKSSYSVNESISSDILLNRPDIKAAEWTVQSTRFDLEAARSAFYPSFSLNAALGLQAFNWGYFFTTPQSIAYQLAGNLLQPVFNRSAIQAQFSYANANQKEALLQYQQLIFTSFMEVSADFLEIKQTEKIKNITFQKLNEYQKASESSLDLYKAARVTYLDVLLTQQYTLQTNIELIKIHNRAHASFIKLFTDLGGQWN
jgi:NodT family efflux transporter outer membrane factor (OMF) lipoprotein